MRDQLKNKKAVVLTAVKDHLQLGMSSDMVVDVDKILRTCEHKQSKAQL